MPSNVRSFFLWKKKSISLLFPIFPTGWHNLLETKAKKTIKKYSMLAKKGAVLVAVSGGADSVALLHFLKNTGCRICVAHLNHCLRGKSAVTDLKFVADMCRGMGVKFISAKADVKKTAKRLKLSVEEAGRVERYVFFERAAKISGVSRIALAHHADDNIETFLMRVMRGAGIRGLCGIPPVRDNIIRPFIDVSKAEILDYCKRNNLQYRQDATNLENRFTRNRIRNLLLPALELENPGIRKEILSLIRGFLSDYALLCRYVSAVSAKAVKISQKGVLVNRAALLSVPEALKGHVMRSAIEKYKGNLNNITAAHIDAILSLRDGYICLPEGIRVIAEEKSYVITDKKEAAAKPAQYRYILKVPGRIHIRAQKMTIKAVYSKRPKDLTKTPVSVAYLDAAKLKGKKLVVRTFRSGDRFIPFGMKGSKKLQDYFVDSKMPLEERTLVPIVCDAEKIVWLAGLRTDERVRVEPSSKTVIRLEILGLGAVL